MKSNFISLIIGAGIGSLITYIILKEKYEMRLQTEIDSVKEVYSNRKEVIIDDISLEFPTQDEDKDKDDVVDELYKIYPKIIKNQKYAPPLEDDPEVIPPEEFGENEDYEVFSLTYYADKILTDDNIDPIDDINNTVGINALESFGEYEDDVVYVRNDRLKCYYEILRDNDKYSEVIKQLPPKPERKPHEIEDE